MENKLKLMLTPFKKDVKRILHLCLICWLIWYSLTISATIAYLSGWMGSIQSIDDFLNDCGKDYYYSSLIIEKDSYYFDDVSGCRENEKTATCVYSIKNSRINNFYNQIHSLDKLSYQFLLAQPKNSVIEPDINQFSKYPSVYTLFNATLNPIKKVWFVTYWKENIIKKVFIITSSKPTTYCNASVIRILKNI